MANATWPTTLPAPAADGSAQYAALVEPVLATSMETGAPKRRRRFTAVPESATLTLKLTRAQIAVLRTFVVTTLQDVLPFDWLDFRDGTAATYVFQKRPTAQSIAGSVDLWTVTLSLMKLP